MLVYECVMIMLMLCKSSYARLTPDVLQAVDTLPCNSRLNSLKIIPRFDGVLPQAHKPIIGRLGEHNRHIVCHCVAVSPSGTYGDLVELHPLLGISLAVVGIDAEDLEAYRPLYNS